MSQMYPNRLQGFLLGWLVWLWLSLSVGDEFAGFVHAEGRLDRAPSRQLGCIGKCRTNVAGLQRRITGENLGAVNSSRDIVEDHRNHDSGPANTCLAMANRRIHAHPISPVFHTFDSTPLGVLVRIRDLAVQPDDGLPKSATFLFRSSRFLREFSQPPQPHTATAFRLQPPRLLFLVDEYPKTNRGQPPQCPRIRRPTLRRRQARLPCQLPQDRPLCQTLGHRFRTPSGSQSQFPTTPIRSTNNWVRSF